MDSESPYTVISNADCGLQPTSGSKGTDAMAPLDGRCDLVPRLIVSPLSYAISTDAGPAAANVRTLVASASDLYYALNATSAFPVAGSVMRVALGGGLPAQVASGYLFGRAALGHTGVLYVAKDVVNNRGDAIVSIPLSGGPATTVVTLPNNDSLGDGLATDGADVYFDDMMGLRAAPLTSDSGPPPIVTITRVTTTGSVFPFTESIGVFDQNLLFTVPQGGIESVPLPAQANSPTTMLAKTGSALVDLARCGSNACWLDQTHHSLELMSPSGGQISRVVLTGSLATTYSFAFDGTDFYVIGTDQTTQTLARVPADGSCPADLVHMPLGLPVAVAVDGECVYWSNAQGIYNLAKVAEGPLVQ